MNDTRRVSLLVKALLWLALHLLVLALAFFVFVRWQLGLGLDSLLSGAAGERLRGFGESVQQEISERPRYEWDAAIKKLADEKKVVAGIFDPADSNHFTPPIPPNILERAGHALPPEAQRGRQRRGAPPWAGGGGPPGRGGPPEGAAPPGGRPLRRGFSSEPDDGPPAREPDRPAITPVRSMFLAHGDGGGYWAGVLLPMRNPMGNPTPELLLIRSERLDGGGMFFDLKPWIWGGAAVLMLSLAFWTPFILSITRYLHKLTLAADGIAAGNFQIHPPPRRSDELGRLGSSIQTMAARLDLHITGQKRFLGDAAHELCAPLARIRAGIGILEHKLGTAHASDLDAIDAEAGELATLIEEILAFSRARIRPANPNELVLETIIHQAIARERADDVVNVDIPAGLTVLADPGLLSRALCNILRNSLIHAGPQVRIAVSAAVEGNRVVIRLTDNGPGVAEEELPRLLEPFYRPDLSRTRETGGSGLGLAIVAAAMEACGGSAAAFLPPGGGFGVRLELPHEPTSQPSPP